MFANEENRINYTEKNLLMERGLWVPASAPTDSRPA